ncbi:DoxX family protein [Catenuloplanes japonicus]|uniref:DoxX family protein n=1 Tax=Catenuloplanes japonicus TaxID=33876 RepID=UPI000526C784|nr:DoxX family protein [Catenuloplanes japonicus]
MNIVLWVIAGLLAVAFGFSGIMKLTQPRAKLVASGQAWAEHAPAGAEKAIGAAELAAAIGLIVPPLVGIATILTPLAATGLVLLMIGAMIVHVVRKEFPMLAPNVVLAILAAIVAWGRFGPHAF